MPPHKKPRTDGAELEQKPEWMPVITRMLEHEKNKDFADAKNIVLGKSRY